MIVGDDSNLSDTHVCGKYVTLKSMWLLLIPFLPATSCREVMFSVVSVNLSVKGGDPHVASAHDGTGQSQVTFQFLSSHSAT